MESSVLFETINITQGHQRPSVKLLKPFSFFGKQFIPFETTLQNFDLNLCKTGRLNLLTAPLDAPANPSFIHWGWEDTKADSIIATIDMVEKKVNDALLELAEEGLAPPSIMVAYMKGSRQLLRPSSDNNGIYINFGVRPPVLDNSTLTPCRPGPIVRYVIELNKVFVKPHDDYPAALFLRVKEFRVVNPDLPPPTSPDTQPDLMIDENALSSPPLAPKKLKLTRQNAITRY